MGIVNLFISRTPSAREGTPGPSGIAVDSSGKNYRVLELTEFHQHRTSAGSGESTGFSSLKTDCGEPVNRVSKGHYKLAMSDIELTSDDANAP